MVDIVIVDSGLGGISLLPSFLHNLSFKKYVYFADTKYLPYGNKSLKRLFEITIFNVKKIIKKFKPKIIVFGCNTIGTTIFEQIKNYFPDQVFYTIKPNVQVEQEKTLLLATNRTISFFNKTKIKNKNIILCKMNCLTNKVENNIQNPENIVPYLKRRLLKYKKIKCIILGCTHYYFIKNQISKIFPKAKFVDGVNNLVSQIKATYCFVKKANKKPKIKLVFTKKIKAQKIYKSLVSNIIDQSFNSN